MPGVRRSLRPGAAVLLFCIATALAAESPLSLSQYTLRLEQARQAVLSVAKPGALSATLNDLPEQWDVTAEGREFSVPLHALRQALSEYDKKPTPAARDAIVAQIELLLRDANALGKSKSNFTAEHERLAEILSRREFRQVAGESWYDRVKRAVQHWLWKLIDRLLLSSAYPTVSRVVIWGMMALAVAVVAWWIVRTYRQGNIYTHFSGSPAELAVKPWRDWHGEAQAAAQEGRWRDAVHLLYWAGIAFLEAQGLWRPDATRTPREYVRLLPAGDGKRARLQQLTRTFEQVWYGNDVATAQTFAGASALLEELECR